MQPAGADTHSQEASKTMQGSAVEIPWSPMLPRKPSFVAAEVVAKASAPVDAKMATEGAGDYSEASYSGIDMAETIWAKANML